MMDRLAERLRRLSVGIAVVGFAGLVVVALLDLADVSLRLLELPRVPGLHDLKEVCYALIVASCFPLGLVEAKHVTVRLVRLVLPQAADRFLETAAAFVTLVFFVVIAAAFGAVALDLTAAGRTTFTLELPMAPWLWAMWVMFLLAVAVQLVVCLQLLTGARGAPGTSATDEPPAFE